MQEKAKLPIWVVVDGDGNYEVGTDEGNARERFGDNIGPIDEADGFRIVRITLEVPLPNLIDVAAQAAAEDLPEVKSC